MITSDEYLVLLGTSPPDDFGALVAQADVEINRATLYGLIGRDVSTFPAFVLDALKLAYAFQVQYLSENADMLNETGAQSFSLGKFSVSAASGSADSSSVQALSPRAKNSLLTVTTYLRGLQK
ncbi:MAG: hypothetical protein Q4D42_07280 [Eubacteriales bacterium]|nr:hypothetical protein [Eubacteriales bacterium]